MSARSLRYALAAFAVLCSFAYAHAAPAAVYDAGTAAPDVAVSNLSVSPADGVPQGEFATVSFDVTNVGDATADSFDLYLNAHLGDARSLMGMTSVGNLAPGETRRVSITDQIDHDAMPGTYTVNVGVLSPGPTGETNTANNYLEGPIEIAHPDVALANLTVSPAAGVLPGQTVTVEFDIVNSGRGWAFDFDVYFSALSSPCRLGTQATIADLAPGQTRHITMGGQIDRNTPPSHCNFQIGILSPGIEGDPGWNDNFLDGSFWVGGADLRPEAPAAPASVAPGESFSASWHLANIGPTPAAGPWDEALYLSRDAAFDAGDVRLAARSVAGPLDGGSGIDVALSATVPAGTAPGDYVLIVRSDDGGAVPELDEGNNVATAALHVRDTTPPVVTATVGGVQGEDGWYVGDVDVSWAVSDAESAFTTSGCADGRVTADTAGTTFTCTATSEGGETAQSVTVRRDTTPPLVHLAAGRAPDGHGWFNHAVDVVTTADDATSGVASCTPAQPYAGPDSASASFTGSCTDRAGNTASAATTIAYDATGPTAVHVDLARSPDHNGWYNHPVGWQAGGEDALSGLDACTSGSYAGPDGAAVHVTGACTDEAGNVTTAESAAFAYDTTPPAIAVTAPAPNAAYLLNERATPVYSCTDATECTAGPLDTSTPGAHAFTVHAVDAAGNEAGVAVPYVVHYATGLCLGEPGHTVLPPLDPAKPTIVNGNRTLPVKFRVCDANGVSIGHPGVAGDAFRWDPSARQWIENLRLDGLAPGTYAYRIDLDDGTSIPFAFTVR